MRCIETHRSSVLSWLATLCLASGCAGSDSSSDPLVPPPPVDAGERALDASESPAAPDGGLSSADASDGQASDATLDGAVTDSALDANEPSEASSPLAAACAIEAQKARCTARSIEMVGAPSDLRKVYWATPTTAAPAAGYPAVLLYQGSFFGPSVTWNVDVSKDTPFGGYYQVGVVAELLERGYVVIQPEAQGSTFWSTNLGGDFAKSVDGVFLPLLLDALRDGRFGKLDSARLYATGMSSGGYMTSRMAVSFPGKFRALAVHSASYATCAGPLCFLPAELPQDHPPTLLLHGAADLTVPISTARDYEAKLRASGIPTRFVQDPSAGHQWLSSAPAEIGDWFDQH